MGFNEYQKTEAFRESCVIGSIISKERNKWYIRKNYSLDNTDRPLCSCGCGQPVSRSKVPPYDWNKFIFCHHTPKNRMRDWNENLKETNPEEYFEMRSNTAIISHKKFKERDPEGYKKRQAMGFTKFHKEHPNFASENAKRIHKMIPDLGARCFKGRLKNMPWKFMCVSFPSATERDVAKLRFEILGIVPINGVNCHIMIKHKEFDFEQFGFIQEHHPYMQPLYKTIPQEEYYKQRREILDSNGHKKSSLIVTENVQEATKLYKWLKEKLEVIA